MKTLTVILVAALVAGNSGYLIKVPEAQQPMRTTSLGWIHIQKLLLPLFENVCEDSTNPVVIRNAQQFNLDATVDVYTNQEPINNLKKLYASNIQLKKGEIFSEFNPDHIYELKLLFDVLYYAPNFDTFYKAACWARQNVNCGLFVDAIYLAILKRRDTEKITVPAPYELLPNYFIQKDVVIKASTLLAGLEVIPTENILIEGNAYTLDANYTGSIEADDESKLAYFHEDIGLNTYYFLKRLQFDFDQNSNHGEYMYHFMKHFVARYNLERYSNGLMLLEKVDWQNDNTYPYDPMLVFSNGAEFSQRYEILDLTSPVYKALRSLEDNVTAIIPSMMQKGYNKTQIINNLMAVLVSNAVQYSYETEACRYFGGDENVENRWRSVLMHRMTSLRDPVFWKINKRIVDIVDDVLKTLPGYSRNELYFPGVKIQNIEVKKIATMFEPFKLDVTNALKSSTENAAFQVNILQNRINHKPFTMKLNISSLVNQKGLVKLYLGPKILPGEFAMKKNLFMLLDNFEVNLKIGSNVISRTSDAINNISRDFTTLKDLQKLVEDAEFGLDVEPPKLIETLTGFPSRLILPKGTPEGLPMQLLAFVAPFTKITAGEINLIPRTEFNSAILFPGYPFDLDFDDKDFFALPNVLVKDIIITHKGSDGASKASGGPVGGKKWSGGDSSATYGPIREPFNYNLKKSQFVESNDLAGKKESNNKENKNVITDTISYTENTKLESKENLNTDSIHNGYDIPENSDIISNDKAMESIWEYEPSETKILPRPASSYLKHYDDYIYE